jgi:hypothetical protein
MCSIMKIILSELNNNNNNNSMQFLYVSACQQRVAYNRPALKLYLTKTGLRLEVELQTD